MRFSWVHPDLADRVRSVLRRGRRSWEEVFDHDTVRTGEPPEGVGASEWPRLAEHVARAERVLEVAHNDGVDAAAQRFSGSPHAVERAALLAAHGKGSEGADADEIAGILSCAVDAWVAYGQYLSRLVELRASRDPAGTVAAFERFVSAAEAVATDEPSWPERVRVARDGLAALYVRVGRAHDADEIYRVRFTEEPGDTTVAIGAARAFLESGDRARALFWLERAAARARDLGRDELARRLSAKAQALRARSN